MTTFSLQFSSHVTEHLIEGCLGGTVRCKPILEVAEFLSRSRVAGDEGNLVDGDAGLQELLGADNGSYGVRVQM